LQISHLRLLVGGEFVEASGSALILAQPTTALFIENPNIGLRESVSPVGSELVG
jgi:hypothetical protein